MSKYFSKWFFSPSICLMKHNNRSNCELDLVSLSAWMICRWTPDRNGWKWSLRKPSLRATLAPYSSIFVMCSISSSYCLSPTCSWCDEADVFRCCFTNSYRLEGWMFSFSLYNWFSNDTSPKPASFATDNICLKSCASKLIGRAIGLYLWPTKHWN